MHYAYRVSMKAALKDCMEGGGRSQRPAASHLQFHRDSFERSATLPRCMAAQDVGVMGCSAPGGRGRRVRGSGQGAAPGAARKEQTERLCRDAVAGVVRDDPAPLGLGFRRPGDVWLGHETSALWGACCEDRGSMSYGQIRRTKRFGPSVPSQVSTSAWDRTCDAGML